MIIVEHILRSIVNDIEEIRLNDQTVRKPSFGWGDKKELNRYLELKKDSAYPLIWLIQSNEQHKRNGKEVVKDCDFIIATRETRKELFNDERFINSFDVVLNPLTESLIKSLPLNQRNQNEWTISKLPNYSENEVKTERLTCGTLLI